MMWSTDEEYCKLPLQEEERGTTESTINESEEDHAHQFDGKEKDDSGRVVARYRVINDALPLCDLLHHSLPEKQHLKHSHNVEAVVDACVVGGVLWKLQCLCRTQQPKPNFFKFWRNLLLVWLIYALLMAAVGISLLLLTRGVDGGDNNNEEPTTAKQGPGWGFGMVLGMVTVLYMFMVRFVEDRLHGTSLALFRSKVESLVQEMAAELETIGYHVQITQPKNKGPLQQWFGSIQGHIHIAVHKSNDTKGTTTTTATTKLPPVSEDFENWSREQPLKESKVNVDSILHYGGQSLRPTTNSSNSSQQARYTLPIDDWLAGGLMMRLRIDRYRAAKRSRWVAYGLLVPTGVLVMRLGLRSSSSNTGNNSIFHAPILALLVGGSLSLIYIYLREYLDGTALHSVSRAVVVQQFSSLAKERHNVTLQYESQPGDVLPRTTKGVIKFLPTETSLLVMQDGSSSSISSLSSSTKKAKASAQLVFV